MRQNLPGFPIRSRCGTDRPLSDPLPDNSSTRSWLKARRLNIARDQKPPPTAAVLDGEQRQLAMTRFAVLQPHLEEEVPLARAAEHAGVPIRTAERWLARYRQLGLAGLARTIRGDAGAHRLP